ncbi:MAG: PEP-CTERM sorting domain-containing protein [Gloeomargaritaceae cyanobacterium C42_A2020_066]|nr:PEP-CTERM sorting domain-containing protein [Gloeomargaritaceae cyanobacterium C42_A2020_066]
MGTSPRPAEAASLTWTLSGFTFDDGTTATGRFNYNADTNRFNRIQITVANPDSASAAFPTYPFPRAYRNSDVLLGDPTQLILAEASAPFRLTPGGSFFQLFFEGSLTNAGGTRSTFALYGVALEPTFADVIPTFGRITSTSRSVPAPPSVVGLLLSGAWAIWRRWHFAQT